MHLINYLKLVFINLPYKKKLLYSYLSFVMIPMVTLSVFFYTRTEEIMRNNFITLSSLYLDQASSSLDNCLSEMLSLGKTFSRQPYLRATLEKDPDKLSLADQGYDLKEMEISINNVYYNTSIYSVRLFVNPDFSYANRNIFTWPLSTAFYMASGKEEWLMKFPQFIGPNSITTSSGTKTVFSLTTPIRGLQDYSQTIALVCIDITQDKVIEIMKSANFSPNGKSYLFDASRHLLLCYSNKEKTLLADASFPGFPKEGQQQYGNSLITVSPLISGNLYIATETPIGQYTYLTQFFPLQFFCFAVVIGILLYFIASFYARTNSRRILQLNNTVKQLQKGDLNTHCIVDSEDEIGELQLSFNDMIQRMRKMIEDQYQLGQRLKNNEFKLLQEQINPHFLYNTLDLAIWAAQNKDSDEVCDIIQKLSRYYRISLSRGKEVILLSEELEHISLYIDLQNKRYEGKLRMLTSADICTEHLKVLKILLQPIVENSILHGLDSSKNVLTIKITVTRKDSMLSIVITDDGCGISSEKLAKIRLYLELNLSAPASLNDPADLSSGYGIINIAERIRNFYRNEASIGFDSVPGQGTSVQILLPYDQCCDRLPK